jgi:tetratricopeptide (TPR) repeat protein
MAETPTNLADIQALNAATLGLMRRGQYSEARLSGERTLGFAEALLGAEHPEVAVALCQLGTIYSSLQKHADAELSFRRALAIQERRGGEQDDEVADTLNAFGVHQIQRRDYEAAESLLRKALTIKEAGRGLEHPDLAPTLHNLAYVCRRQARYDEADDLYRRAAEILERAHGPMSADLAFALEGHAASNEESGRYDVAEALYRRALLIREGKPARDKALATLLNNLALLLWKAGKPEEGERLSLRSIEIFEELLGPGHPLVADCLFDLASHHEAQGQYQEAERCYRRAVAIQEARLPGLQLSSERQVVIPSEYLTLAQSLLALVRVCERVSKHGEAERIRARIHYTGENEPFAGVESVPGHPGWVEAPFAGGESIPAPPPGEKSALDESRARSRRWWQFWK